MFPLPVISGVGKQIGKPVFFSRYQCFPGVGNTLIPSRHQ